MKRAPSVLALVSVGVLLLVVILLSPRTQFMMGGALVNAGFAVQDSLHDYDFGKHELTPQEVWKEFEHQNQLASMVREKFPRSTEHPVVAMMVCMDARIDTSELAGDTRRYYYVLRTAGSVLGEEEQEMLELAVRNGVKVVVLTRHSDCAAEKMAANPASRADYPRLSVAIDEREAHIKAFLERPLIASRVASGELLVKQVFIDTHSEHLVTAEVPRQ